MDAIKENPVVNEKTAKKKSGGKKKIKVKKIGEKADKEKEQTPVTQTQTQIITQTPEIKNQPTPDTKSFMSQEKLNEEITKEKKKYFGKVFVTTVFIVIAVEYYTYIFEANYRNIKSNTYIFI